MADESEELYQKMVDEKITIKITRGENYEELIYEMSGRGNGYYGYSSQFLTIYGKNDLYLKKDLTPLCIEMLEQMLSTFKREK